MNYLKTLLWVVLAVVIAIFATANWNDVSIKLWANLQAEVKLPVLLLLVFLLGFLPTYLVMRGRNWRLQRKLALAERPAPPPVPAHSALSPDEEGSA